MRIVELRRHTMRVIPGKHLSQAGVTLARTVGQTMGHFDQVLTSELPRAYETAIAMGYAVDGQYPELNTTGDSVEAEVPYPASPAQYSAAIKAGGAASEAAKNLYAFLKKVVQTLPNEAAVLMISHGGVVELAAIGCMPNEDHAAWGAPFSYCEGVRLSFEDGQFTHLEILRVDQGNPSK